MSPAGPGFPVLPVRHGYFLPQELVVTGAEWRHDPGWIFSSTVEARPWFEFFRGKLEAVEFIPFVYDACELAPVVEVAKQARDYGMDLWFAPRFFKQIDYYPYLPPRFCSRWMNEKGEMGFAMRDVKRRPDLDRMNPEAVSWFLQANEDLVLRHFPRDTLHGLFWPEEHLGANLAVSSMASDPSQYYWRPCFSDFCL